MMNCTEGAIYSWPVPSEERVINSLAVSSMKEASTPVLYLKEKEPVLYPVEK
jgi:hypothetical protein